MNKHQVDFDWYNPVMTLRHDDAMAVVTENDTITYRQFNN